MRLPTLLLLALPSVALAQSAADLREKFTKHEFRIPVRDGTRLFTAVYVPKDAGPDKLYPILLTRTPYSAAPYGVDQYPDRLRPGPHLVEAGYIFAVQDVRGQWMSEGKFENMRPHNPAKSGKEFDESSDTFDSIDWLLKHVPHHNGKVGQTGVSYPGFYTACRHDRRPPGSRMCRQPTSPDQRTGSSATTFTTTVSLLLPHCFNFMASFGKPVSRSQLTKWRLSAVRARHSGRVRLLPRKWARCTVRRQEAPEGSRWHSGTRTCWRHGSLRRLLEGQEPAAAPEKHHAGGPDRWRLVRRREPVRRAGDVQAGGGDGGAEGRQHAGDGAVGPRRLAAGRRRQAGRRDLRRQDRRVVPQGAGGAVLRAPPEGQGATGSRPRRGPSRRAPTSGGGSTPGRRPTRNR